MDTTDETASEETSNSPWEKYRLSSQRPELAREGWASEGPFAQDQEPAEPESIPSGGKGFLIRIWNWLKAANKVELAIVIASAIGIVSALYLFASGTDIGSVGLFALISMIPLALVMTVLLRADQYAPMGWRYILLAVLWGAGVATAVASVFNSAMLSDFIATFGDMKISQNYAATFVAPVTEELLKGSGAILILLMARSRVVSSLNGLVVAGTVGAAFAFVENIQYFIEAQAQGTAVLGATIVGRLVLSPFIHPMATSFVGYFFASAILHNNGAWSWTWRILVGFGTAMATHGLWNGLASLGGPTWMLLYVLIEVPLFVAWLVWVSTRGSRQLKLINQGLTPYVATGWISPEEQRMVTVPSARKYAKRWAKNVGPGTRTVMRKYLQTAGRLGLDQTNMEKTGPDPKRVDIARTMLSALAEYRDAYLLQGQISAATAGAKK